MSLEERQHTSKHYEQQLRNIKDKLLLMSHKAEQMIADAIVALVERRPSLAEDVIRRDDEIDKLELQIDDLCFSVLALEQPVARDLRFIATSLKIVRDVERIGDVGVNIAERVVELLQEPELKPLIDLPIMAAAAQKILKESLDAFVSENETLALKVIKDDRHIDNHHQQIFRELLTYMMEDTHNISRALKLIFIAKGLERVGDHSANIGEMVIFMVRGKDIRHGTNPDSG